MEVVFNRILDMMGRWSPEGQGIFMFLMVLIGLGFSYNVLKLIIVFFRGWPEPEKKCHQGKTHVTQTQ